MGATVFKQQEKMAETASLLADGWTGKDIAAKIGVSTATITNWRRKLKLGIQQKELIAEKGLDSNDFGYGLDWDEIIQKGTREVEETHYLPSTDGKVLVAQKVKYKQSPDLLKLALYKKGLFEDLRVLQGDDSLLKGLGATYADYKKQINKYLFSEQRAVIWNAERFKRVICGRRAGKSELVAVALVEAALRVPGCAVGYANRTLKQAKAVIHRYLVGVCAELGVDLITHGQDSCYTVANSNSVIYLYGNDTRDECDKAQGQGYSRFVIDEVQSHRNSFLRHFVVDIVQPALADHAGDLWLVGTPPRRKAGWLYDVMKNNAWHAFHWTMWQNPFIPNPDEELVAICESRDVDSNDPAIRREFFGELAESLDDLIFPLSERSYCLPSDVDMDRISFICVGVDLGYDDADAIAVWGEMNDGKAVLIYEYEQRYNNISDIAQQLKMVYNQYKPIEIVVDRGGLGKKIVMELENMTGLCLAAAQKYDKVSAAETLGADLGKGVALIDAAGPFAEDSAVMMWDYDAEDGQKEKRWGDSAHSDIADAVLYGYRALREYSSKYSQMLFK